MDTSSNFSQFPLSQFQNTNSSNTQTSHQFTQNINPFTISNINIDDKDYWIDKFLDDHSIIIQNPEDYSTSFLAKMVVFLVSISSSHNKSRVTESVSNRIREYGNHSSFTEKDLKEFQQNLNVIYQCIALLFTSSQKSTSSHTFLNTAIDIYLIVCMHFKYDISFYFALLQILPKYNFRFGFVSNSMIFAKSLNRLFSEVFLLYVHGEITIDEVLSTHFKLTALVNGCAEIIQNPLSTYASQESLIVTRQNIKRLFDFIEEYPSIQSEIRFRVSVLCSIKLECPEIYQENYANDTNYSNLILSSKDSIPNTLLTELESPTMINDFFLWLQSDSTNIKIDNLPTTLYEFLSRRFQNKNLFLKLLVGKCNRQLFVHLKKKVPSINEHIPKSFSKLREVVDSAKYIRICLGTNPNYDEVKSFFEYHMMFNLEERKLLLDIIPKTDENEILRKSLTGL